MKTLLARVTLACVAAACSDSMPSGPVEDCAVQSDGTMTCPRSFPGCTLQLDVAVQFARCGHRNEYVVYGRVEGCPSIYYYQEGSFLSPGDWEAFVGPCNRRVAGE